MLCGLRLTSPSEKAVLVSNFTSALDQISILAVARGWSTLRIDGKHCTALHCTAIPCYCLLLLSTVCCLLWLAMWLKARSACVTELLPFHRCPLCLDCLPCPQIVSNTSSNSLITTLTHHFHATTQSALSSTSHCHLHHSVCALSLATHKALCLPTSDRAWWITSTDLRTLDSCSCYPQKQEE